MGHPATITRIRFRTTPYIPESGTLTGPQFEDVFRVYFDVTVPEDPECDRFKIHVEVYDEDDTSPDDLIAGSPFPVDRCYKLKPGNFRFYIGSVDPFGDPLPNDIQDIQSAHRSAGSRGLKPGNYRLPGWSPIRLDGDPGSYYEFYAYVRLIPCCEDADEINFQSLVQDSRMVGGPDAVETTLRILQQLSGAAQAAAERLGGGGGR